MHFTRSTGRTGQVSARQEQYATDALAVRIQLTCQQQIACVSRVWRVGGDTTEHMGGVYWL